MPSTPIFRSTRSVLGLPVPLAQATTTSGPRMAISSGATSAASTSSTAAAAGPAARWMTATSLGWRSTASGNGFQASTSASCLPVRTTTGVSTPKCSTITSCTAVPTLAADRSGESRTTLPLLTYVRTSLKPDSASTSRSFGMETLLCAPRFTARSRATQVGTARS